MENSFKFLTPKELIDGGYVQEVNRLFFHPLGLALAVNPDQDIEDHGYFAIQIWDCRDDPEGFEFGEYPGAWDKMKKVASEFNSKAKARLNKWKHIGEEIPEVGVVQPIEAIEDLNDYEEEL